MKRLLSPPRLRQPSSSALLVVALLVGFLAVLLVSGLTSAQIGNDAKGARDEGSSANVPDSVLSGGSIVDGRQDPAASVAVPAKTIALTFDDGPDPTWTPEVLAVLQKHKVAGTFFVVGSMAAQHPDLIRAIHDSGSELGVHTFMHPDLGTVPQWRVGLELGETERVLAGATGTTTYLMRPPYSSSASALDDLGYETVREAGELGYLTIFTDVDSEDWQRPGVDAIVRNSTPQNGAGAIVLMHDAGGDRSQTVAALDRLIPELQRQGYTFTTVTGAVGLPPADGAAPASESLLGGALLGAVDIAHAVLDTVRWALFVVAALVIARLLLMLVVAGRQARRRNDPSFTWGPAVREPVSVIVPAYNERENIEATVRSILANDHPLEVLVVDDGSTDGTADLVERLGLPRVRVIRQRNSGKATALNAGIAHARHDLIVTMDGDTIFEQDTVRHIVQPFADPTVGAVAGNVKVAETGSLIARLQHIEYVVGFGIDRRVQDRLGAITTIPGAAGAFRRGALLQVGGLSNDTLAEDTDLTIALQRAGWRAVYEDRALAWTEAPATAQQLWRQRYRWSYGTMQAVWKHRAAVRARGAEGRFGRAGLLQVLAFHILLPLTAPLVDIFLVYGLLFSDPATTVLLWSAMMLLQLVGAVYAFRLDGEPKGALWVFPAQQVLYRQVMYAVLVQSVLSALSGVRVRWQKLRRVGGLDELLADMERPRPAPVATVVPAQRVPADGASDSPTVAPPVAASPAPVPAATGSRAGRDRWFDLLRAAALARVLVYHVLNLGWLSLVFPSMGVMFALGGSLMVQSLRKMPPLDVIGHRLRRLLPPFWLFGMILVPVMVLQGWATESDDGIPWRDFVYWVVPVLDPPGSEWATDATVVLWYIRAYLWFVLLTPLMLRAFRRWPVASVLAPIAVVGLDAAAGSPLAGGPVGQAVLDFCVFGACWMLGFAHREGMLRRMPIPVLVTLAALGIGLGTWWAFGHPSPTDGLDLNEIPLAQALVSAGAVLLFLRVSPRLAWLDRVPVLGRLVTVINARAITIYLTHNVMIDAAAVVDDHLGWESQWAHVGTSVLLTALAVLAFGWIEDVAARRPLQLVPGGRRAAQQRRPEPPAGPTRPRTLSPAVAARIAARPDATVLTLPVQRTTDGG